MQESAVTVETSADFVYLFDKLFLSLRRVVSQSFPCGIRSRRTGLFALEKGKVQTGSGNNLGEGLGAVATVAGLEPAASHFGGERSIH